MFQAHIQPFLLTHAVAPGADDAAAPRQSGTERCRRTVPVSLTLVKINKCIGRVPITCVGHECNLALTYSDTIACTLVINNIELRYKM